MGFDDYIKILRRRLRVILIPALVGAALGYLVTLVIPAEYTSRSLILIESPTVPEAMVPTVSTEDLFTRLATMQEQIESRSRLQPLIERYDLYKSERKSSMEDAVDDMRKAITVRQETFETDAEKNNQKHPVPGFSVSFQAENARLAQQVCTELTSMFMSEDLQQHEQAAKGTTEFLTNEVAEAKRALDDQDAKLAQFKQKNLGSLPDDTQANLQVLATINTQLSAATDQLNRAQQNRAYEQTLLTQQEAAWKSNGGNSEEASTLQGMKDELAKMKQNLAIEQGRYTDDYPDVIKLKKDIADLQKEIDAQIATDASASSETASAKTAEGPGTAKPAPVSGGSPSSPQKPQAPSGPAATAQNSATPGAGGASGQQTTSQLPPPSIQQLRAQIKQDDIFIASKTKELEKLQQQAKVYESRIQVSPTVEEEYNQLALGREAALKFYNGLLANRDTSQMSVNLETRGQGEHFGLLDSADLPDTPSFPVWWEFALGGLGVGLVVGISLAAAFELGDKALRDERDVEFYLGMPTLALIPSLGAENGDKNGRRGFLGRRKRRELPAAAGEVTKVSA